jgi:hypothetical protein
MFRDAKKDLATQTVRLCRVSILTRCRKGYISPVRRKHPRKTLMVWLGDNYQRVVVLDTQHRVTP